MTPEDLARFLGWLDPDPEKAGRRYERIQRKLTVIFSDLEDPKEAADKCIDRVIRKLPEIIDQYKGEPEYYFWSVAAYIRKEEVTRRRKRLVFLLQLTKYLAILRRPSADEESLARLDQCLSFLKPSSRRLILEFHQNQGKAKITQRAMLADEMGITLNALRIKAHRLRRSLEKCLKACRREKRNQGSRI